MKRAEELFEEEGFLIQYLNMRDDCTSLILVYRTKDM